MLWQRCVCLVLCLSSLAAAVSLRQCNSQGLVTVSPDQPYNVTCPHDETTYNVTWLFTSLLDPPVNYVITKECVLFSRSLDAYCDSQVPGFRVVRPQFGYTGLQVDWGHLSRSLTFGMVTCLLDGVTSGTCFLRLMAPDTSSTSTTAPSSAVTSHLPSTSSPSSGLSQSPTTEQTTEMMSSNSATEVTSAVSTIPSTEGEGTSSSSSAMSSPGTMTSESSISDHSDTPTTTTTNGNAGSPSPPTSATATTTTNTSTETSGLSPHTQRVIIIAVVVGLVATVPAIIVGIIVFCLRRKRRQRFQSMNNDEGSLQVESTMDDTKRDSSFGPPPSKN